MDTRNPSESFNQIIMGKIGEKREMADYWKKRQRKIYTDHELTEFDKQLEPYRTTKKSSNGEEISYIDEVQFLKEFTFTDQNGIKVVGLISPNGAYKIGTKCEGYDEDKKNKGGETYTDIGDNQPINIMLDKIKQWRDWRYRKNYGEEKKLEGLDEVYQKIKVADTLPFGTFED